MSAVVLDLKKKFELKLEKAGFTQVPILRTRLAVDKSGSMVNLYREGFVNKSIELFMGAAAKFDDDGNLEYTFFNGDADRLDEVDLSSYSSMRIPSAGGGTNYVPALKELTESKTLPAPNGLFSSIFGKKDAPANEGEAPIYIGFITDGDPSDHSETLKFLESLDKSYNFVQFIVLGYGVTRSYMEQYAKYPNVDFKIIGNPSKMSVDELYEVIANEKLLAWTKTL